MTTHWRPLMPAQLRVQDTKAVFGHQVYRFDARCDQCYWSGPFSSFVEFFRAGEVMQICKACANSNDSYVALRKEGWDDEDDLPF